MSTSKHCLSIVRTALELVKPQFRLPLDHGYHGIKHWVRVWANAQMLCRKYEVDPTVPCWFAFLHDSQRCNEDRDFGHGARASDWAAWLWRSGQIPHELCTPGQMNQLVTAMDRHSNGDVVSVSTAVSICWDADRLDLGRCGIRPEPARLCTEHARRPDVIEAAWQRSRAGFDNVHAKMRAHS